MEVASYRGNKVHVSCQGNFVASANLFCILCMIFVDFQTKQGSAYDSNLLQPSPPLKKTYGHQKYVAV